MVTARFGAHSPLTHPFFDSFVVNRFIDGIIDLANDIAGDPNHEVHTKFSEWLRDFAEHLETDAALKAQVTEILRQFLGRIDMDALVRDAWHAIQAGGAGFDLTGSPTVSREFAGTRGVSGPLSTASTSACAVAVASGLSGAGMRLSRWSRT